MRGALFLLMVFDHTIHGYAQNWAPFWFMRDFDRVLWLDGLYLFNQAIIIPGIFFVFGAHLIKDYAGSLNQFIRLIALRYGLPTLAGLLIIVPILTYPKYVHFENPQATFYQYWSTTWWDTALQAGPFWVMISLALLSILVMSLHRVHAFRNFVGPVLEKLVSYRLYLFAFYMLSICIYFLSDLIWGAPWWIGYFRLISVQGSKFIMNSLFFILGYGYALRLDYISQAVSKGKVRASYWVIAVLVIGFAYGVYSVNQFDKGAFSYDLRLFLASGGDIFDAWPVLSPYIFKVFSRTFLLGILVPTQLIALILIFKAKKFKGKFLNLISDKAWGIFIFHEAVVVWGQYLLIPYNVSIYLKVLGIFFLAFASSLFISMLVSRGKFLSIK